MPKSKKLVVNRRGFLKGAATAAAGAAAIATQVPESGAQTQQTPPAGAPRSNTPAPPPTAAQLERDAGAVRPPTGGNTRAAVRPVPI